VSKSKENQGASIRNTETVYSIVNIKHPMLQFWSLDAETSRKLHVTFTIYLDHCRCLILSTHVHLQCIAVVCT